MNVQYPDQVNLLLRVIPAITEIEEFAIHGGSAINLFYNELPRLSVDIDLTFIPLKTREEDLSRIHELLSLLKETLNRTIPGISIGGPKAETGELKLYCSLNRAEVKIEVNTVNRGIFGKVKICRLCKTAEERFNIFCEARIVPYGQLYGGKIVAALDRQHPRDLFDIWTLMQRDGIDEEIMTGFIFCLLSSNRPIHELLNPTLLDHSASFDSQFSGMTEENFTYEIYEFTRSHLIETIRARITREISEFLVSFSEGSPNLDRYQFEGYPGIQWKLLNINKLKKENPSKFEFQIEELRKTLKL